MTSEEIGLEEFERLRDEMKLDHKAELRDSTWSCEWVEEDPDPVMKEVECGTSYYFRCEPEVADFIVEAVNAYRQHRVASLGFLEELEREAARNRMTLKFVRLQIKRGVWDLARVEEFIAGRMGKEGDQ